MQSNSLLREILPERKSHAEEVATVVPCSSPVTGTVPLASHQQRWSMKDTDLA